MHLTVTEAEVVSLDGYEKTDIEGVFVNKDRCRVAFVRGDSTILVSDMLSDSLEKHEAELAFKGEPHRTLMEDIAMEVQTFMGRATGDILDYVDERLCGLPCGGDSINCHRTETLDEKENADEQS